MDRDKYFELLLTEKQQADSAIIGYADLHVKLFGFFGIGVTILGWLYGEKGTANGLALPTSFGIVAVALVVISCGIVVHGVSTYALTLGYIQYKNEVLNPIFRELLALDRLPLKAVETWARGEARSVTLVSSLYLFILHKCVAVVLLIATAYSFTRHSWTIALIVVSWLLLLLCVAVEGVAYRAISKVLLHRPS